MTKEDKNKQMKAWREAKEEGGHESMKKEYEEAKRERPKESNDAKLR